MKFPDLMDKLKSGVSEKNKLVLIGLVCILILYLDFSLIIKLQLKVIRNVSGKAARAHKDLSNFAKDTAYIEELKRSSRVQPKKEQALKVKKAMTEEELPLLLQDISDMANKSNVKIVKIQPSRDPKHKEELVGGKKFSALTINLSLSCGYHSLGSFIGQLDDSTYFLAVEEIKIRQGSADYMLQNVNLGLRTYVKR